MFRPEFQPEDPLAPPVAAFDEPWQAQALALADAMVQAGHFSTSDWAEALGASLKEAEAAGAPDTLDTYYTAVLTALEHLAEAKAGIDAGARKARRAGWEKAYRRTPHGQPVILRPSDG
ncbi:nitrile hydratase accessory protein [Pseudoruegeria sp. SHC-113]|uniref:nitrile hydratase accessory protein n=1 Tax=Pseudoruegeria sp. SHC-113 TaxID=2855439 RepID=UPI0021BB663F|nr:nitrile hydratase accessory protein [Pseudoruegeria sp. SHC-113]MCT8159271.1 nitrile hydratase accessory protein [Pseudoruegeria sp. SHC-113]